MFQPVCELLSEAGVEALFVQVTTALCVTIVLDGVDRLPEGYRIRSHDFYGPLPSIEIESTRNIAQALDGISLSVARLGATVRFRRELATQARECKFVVPTSIGKVTVVGICTGGRTVRARGENACQAYQKLNRKMTELSPQAGVATVFGRGHESSYLPAHRASIWFENTPFWKEASTCPKTLF